VKLTDHATFCAAVTFATSAGVTPSSQPQLQAANA